MNYTLIKTKEWANPVRSTRLFVIGIPTSPIIFGLYGCVPARDFHPYSPKYIL